jgi:biotin synthase
MDKNDILCWLRISDEEELASLWKQADSIRRQCVGDDIYLRGIIEISNRCRRDCLYCGINSSAAELSRYTMEPDEILDAVTDFAKFKVNTVVLQAGESPHLTRNVVSGIVKRIKDEYGIAITLGLGERETDDYMAWKEAGADRYLLKFETSNPALFARLHPSNRDGWEHRIETLRILRDLGYETGSGVMIGLPGQTFEDLANDICLFRELDVDMIGAGPYIPHPGTALGSSVPDFIAEDDQVPSNDEMTYKTMALTRLIRPYANIPSTTALSTIYPVQGRILALQRGANVIMPDFTPLKYRSLYDIYPKLKPSVSDMETQMRNLHEFIMRLGRTVGAGGGISLNYKRRHLSI